MTGGRRLLRVGEYLIGRACRDLPGGNRDERCREWVAELPAILHDPAIRFAPRRAARMLRYAAGTFRGTLAPGSDLRRPADRWIALLGVIFACGLLSSVNDVWGLARVSGQWMSYVQLTWDLLEMALPIGMYVRVRLRTMWLIVASSVLAGAVVNISLVVRAPGDWVSYFGMAMYALALVGALSLLMWKRRHPRHA